MTNRNHSSPRDLCENLTFWKFSGSFRGDEEVSFGSFLCRNFTSFDFLRFITFICKFQTLFLTFTICDENERHSKPRTVAYKIVNYNMCSLLNKKLVLLFVLILFSEFWFYNWPHFSQQKKTSHRPCLTPKPSEKLPILPHGQFWRSFCGEKTMMRGFLFE